MKNFSRREISAAYRILPTGVADEINVCGGWFLADVRSPTAPFV
jgi:hypothetical protein